MDCQLYCIVFLILWLLYQLFFHKNIIIDRFITNTLQIIQHQHQQLVQQQVQVQHQQQQ